MSIVLAVQVARVLTERPLHYLLLTVRYHQVFQSICVVAR